MLHTLLVIAAIASVCLMCVRSLNLFWLAVLTVALLVGAHVLRRFRMPHRANLKLFLLNAGLTLVAVGVGLAIIEIGARVLLYPYPPEIALYEIDLENAFDLRPGARASILSHPDGGEPRPVEVHVSSQAVRGPLIGPKAPGEFRVVLAGDSFAFGYAVEDSETIPVQLERLLREAHPNRTITVINLGVSGTTVSQHLGYLRKRGFGFEPDLVIQSVFLGNDVVELMADRGVQPVAYAPDLEGRYINTRLLGTRRYSAELWLARRSRAYFAFRRQVTRKEVFRFLAKEMRPLPRIDFREWGPSAARPWRWEGNLAAWYPELTAGFDELVQRLDETRRECEQRGFEFAVFCVPLPEEVVPGLYDARVRPFLGEGYESGKGNGFVRTAMEQRGIPIVPVDTALLAHESPESLYFSADGHTTPEGNRVIAGVLAEFVEERFLGVAPGE